jgi:hypothetical protein
MSTRAPGRPAGTIRAGRVSVVSALVGLVSLGWIAIVSATPLDPPTWLRVLGAVPMPLGFTVAVGAGLAGLRGPDRRLAVVGLALAAVIAVVLTGLSVAFE